MPAQFKLDLSLPVVPSSKFCVFQLLQYYLSGRAAGLTQASSARTWTELGNDDDSLA